MSLSITIAEVMATFTGEVQLILLGLLYVKTIFVYLHLLYVKTIFVYLHLGASHLSIEI